MPDNPVSTLRQAKPQGSAEVEERAGRFHDGLDACREKLCKDSGAIKILDRLSGRGPKFVDDAVQTLMTLPTTRDSKIYQLFLHDILRHSGSGLLVLCAASLGKQRVVHLAENDRVGLVSYIKDNKANLHCPALELLAEEYQIPSVNGLYNAFLLSL